MKWLNVLFAFLKTFKLQFSQLNASTVGLTSVHITELISYVYFDCASRLDSQYNFAALKSLEVPLAVIDRKLSFQTNNNECHCIA